jgi:hypothetical protein
MAHEGSKPQFFKIGPATKMTLQVVSSIFSTLKESRYIPNDIMIQYRSYLPFREAFYPQNIY